MHILQCLPRVAGEEGGTLARSCSVCQHEDSVLINEALVVQGLSNRAMTRQFGLSKDAVRRHWQHIP
jgi:hypothetical protein